MLQVKIYKTRSGFNVVFDKKYSGMTKYSAKTLDDAEEIGITDSMGPHEKDMVIIAREDMLMNTCSAIYEAGRSKNTAYVITVFRKISQLISRNIQNNRILRLWDDLECHYAVTDEELYRTCYGNLSSSQHIYTDLETKSKY